MKPEFIALGLILASALYLFWTQKLRTDITALLVMLCLALPWPHQDGKWAGILTPQEAFAGFGSVAVIMVTAMFIFSAALVRTGVAEIIGGRLFRAAASNELLFQIAVFAVATVCSMFINETTIVLVFMPVVLGVCKERNLSPSRYLLCAAYGAALGGEWTLIGTRSSIVVSAFLRQRTGQGIGFFDFTPIAATVFVGCATYFFLVGRRFLPKAAVQSLEQELGKEYLTEVMVTPQSATVGLTLDQLDWAKRQDVPMVGVIREGERMPPNGWMKLHPGDALIMQGAVPTIGSLLKSPDFKFMEEVKIGEKTLRSLDLITVEALLSPNSRYTGRTMQQTNFGRDYGFSVKVTDTYKSVNWQAVATVGGMMSVGLALEKTGAAGALAHVIVIHLQSVGTNLILCALLALTVALTQDRKRGGGHHPRADCLPNRARRPRRSKAFHGGIGHLHFNVVLHARRPRDHHAGDGARPIPFQALPFYRQWNGRHRLAAHHARDPASLEVLIRKLATPVLRRPPSFRSLEIYQHLSCTDLRQGNSKSKSQKSIDFFLLIL